MKVSENEWLDSHEHGAANEQGGFRLFYSECDPGLSLETRETMIADLKRVMPRFDVAQYFRSQPTIFSDYDHLVVALDDQARAIGMIGARWLQMDQEDFLYLWTAMVGDEYRRSSLFRSVVAYCFAQIAGRRGFPGIVATKTYNPVVYNIMHALTKGLPDVEFFPNISGEQTQRGVAIAKRIASTVCPSLEFRPESGLVVGGQAVLAPDFFPEMQRTNNQVVFDYFAKHLTRDDQILCFVVISDKAKAVLADKLRRQVEGAEHERLQEGAS